ncbi:MAG: D-isomer specific 2-hydroxyacid dehydrogenase family protein [Erysipelotrichaceae bacterium]|nr:D-isomer specific 2-hydroxyacid dehydrogenase family protein [Erysipelotrichaceae bacterium]
MKIAFFSVRIDEIDFVKEYAKKYDVEVCINNEALTLNNVGQCKGYDAVSIMTTKTDKEIIKILHDFQVVYISTRTIGFDHIDLEACKEYGIHVGNVSYSLASVAEYTVMMILMSLRNMKLIVDRFASQDFSLQHIRGKELSDLTVGIIGTGKIGKEVIQRLSAFSCHMMAYDINPNNEVENLVDYVDLNTLFENSDIITLHAPSNSSTYHIINEESLQMMKDGVVIINTARGSLINTDDLIDAIESQKVGYAALDVIENESHLYYEEYKNEVINHRQLSILRSFPNVLLTPHTAFFTNHAVSDMVEYSILSSKNTYENHNNPWLIV